MRVIVTRTHQQVKVARRRDRAKAFREHKAYHMAFAKQLNDEADKVQAELDKGNVPEESLQEASEYITHLRSEAIGHENAKCLDEH